MKKLFSALLAGAMLLAMGLSLVACGSKATQAFYTLEAAYQNGLVEYADVLEIHKNYVLPEEQKLSLQEEEAIKRSFFENFEAVMQDKDVSGPVPDAEEKISVMYYHGKFNGYYVVTVTYFYGHFYCRGMIGCSIDIIMPASKILRYFTCVSKPSNTGFMLSNVKISLARKAA